MAAGSCGSSMIMTITEHCGDVALPARGRFGRTLAGRPCGGLGGDVDRAAAALVATPADSSP
jgi:hypothetical protein